MRYVLLIILLGLTPCLVVPQDADRVRAEEVKQAVQKVAGSKKTNVQVVLNDLREREGKVVGVYEDKFAITLKEKKKALITIGTRNSRPTFFIKYSDVLQLEGKGVELSYVPDPMQSPYSAWEKLKDLGAGEFLQIDLTNGKRVHGVFFRYADDKLVLIRGNAEIDIPKDYVARLYRVTGDTSGLASKLVSGGTKGIDISDGIFPIVDPRARAHPGALAIGSVAGALLYILPRGGTKRVLAFAK